MSSLTYIKSNEDDFYCDDYMVMMNYHDCKNCNANKNCTNKNKVLK